MRRLGFVLLAALLAVALSGCEDLLENTWTFTNRSSYNVKVEPRGGQDWTGFTLRPAGEHEVELEDDEIHFRYSPADRVYADENDDHITFYNL